MDRIELGKKLNTLREQAGLTLIEAARRLGFPNYQTLSKIEAGEREVKAAELPIFAKVYYFDPNTLLFNNTTEKKEPTFLWRNQPEEDKRKEVEQYLLNKSRQFQFLEKLLNEDKIKQFNFIASNIENIRTKNNIDNLAEEVRKLLELGGRPAFSLKKNLEQKFNIKIIYKSLADIGSAASIVNEEYGSIIVINSDEVPWRQNYDMAHELFHLITWHIVPAENLQDSQYFEDLEKKANRFASTLLLPAEEVRKQILDRLESQKKIDAADLVDIAIEFGVSREALIYRLYNLGMIKWETSQKYSNDEYLRSLDRVKRNSENEGINERFNSLAIRCLRKGLISRGKFAEMVEIDRSDIDLFIENSGLIKDEGESIEIVAA